MRHKTLGWAGMVCILAAYILLTFGYFPIPTTPYHMLNLFGCIALSIDVAHAKQWPAFTLQIVFALVAAWTILQETIHEFIFWF